MIIYDPISRESLQYKKRIVIKVGSSSLVHPETGGLNLLKLDRLVRVICDLKNRGLDVVLVSSGAIGVGRKALGFSRRPDRIEQKQACASVGQAMLMMIYQKLFREYNHTASQILLTKHTIVRKTSCKNAQNTFNELLRLGIVPIVNENDTVSTSEIEFGDNDTLSAVVAAIINADLLILLSDIDGLYTDDPSVNDEARFIRCVTAIDDSVYALAKGSNGEYGTGGMRTKIDAARIANDAGCDMIIANGEDFTIVDRLIGGSDEGTMFLAHKSPNFNILDYIEPEHLTSGLKEEIHEFNS